ncbi:MFS transporter [Catenuloplanes atrovinosus]|uniref:MFS family arabinose efflux permease n=1 Tax=Catenuloplanes atrovinosus TaxID=137266 RepID=A0AAE3YQH6_9ACTN|nr:MFS transporter [Catenuloplanes atrovinosus]MDR7276558.1 putative MFS family arabinose efflux permease [Catenuloplanes atrovinosus]
MRDMSPRAWTLLTLLAVATLLVMTTETLPIGLLPQVARGLGVAEDRVGLLVTGYGAVVVVAAVPLSAVIARFPIRLATLGVLAVLVVSIGVTAASPGLPTAFAARLLGGAAHAVFYSCTFVMATSAVPERLHARAVAVVGAGNAVALALGVPAATAVGASAGWRTPFWIAAVALTATAVAIGVVYRPVAASEARPTAAGHLLRAAVAPPLLRVAATIVLVMTAHFVTYTYVAPLLTGSGIAERAVSLVLLGYGVAGVAGLVVAGRFAQSRLSPLLVASVAITFAALTLLWLLRGSAAGTVAAIILWGTAFGAAPTLWQLTAVRAAPRAASIGPAVVNSAFNVGISAGAWAGGLVLTDLGTGALPLLSMAVLAAAGILLLRRPTSAPPSRHGDEQAEPAPAEAHDRVARATR